MFLLLIYLLHFHDYLEMKYGFKNNKNGTLTIAYFRLAVHGATIIFRSVSFFKESFSIVHAKILLQNLIEDKLETIFGRLCFRVYKRNISHTVKPE